MHPEPEAAPSTPNTGNGVEPPQMQVTIGDLQMIIGGLQIELVKTRSEAERIITRLASENKALMAEITRLNAGTA